MALGLRLQVGRNLCDIDVSDQHTGGSFSLYTAYKLLAVHGGRR